MEEKFDYQKLGLKCGLEVHQQLDTQKLFCNCSSLLRQNEPDFTVKRKLHTVAGESGKIDIAAKHEMEKNKEFIYQGYDTTCLVELDEEPPHQINIEALKIALQISILLNAKILPITQIMRKTVIDGSNTSGFQRSVLIARDGYVETKYGNVVIKGIFLEEDAARIISKDQGISIFRLDRLGIPLIEVTTAPDIKSPEQAKEVALHIGDILRSCKVKRGLGTIRQDVNMSIKGGARTEIKGVQDPDLIAKTIDSEIKRQIEIIKKGKTFKPEVRNALSSGETEFLRPLPGAARMYPETDLPLLRISREMINQVKKGLPKLRSEIEEELISRGLNKEMIKLLLSRNLLSEFEALLKLYNNHNFIIKSLVLWPKEIAIREKLSEKEIQEKLSIDIIESLIEKVARGRIKESEIKGIMTELAKGKTIEEVIGIKREEINIEERILKIIKEKPGLSENAYMGLIMKNSEFKGKIDGKEIMEIIKKFMKH